MLSVPESVNANRHKKLYNLIRYLTGTSAANPLPPSLSDEEMQMNLQTIL